MFEANCHCGNVTLRAEAPPTTVTSCNCSICHRLGAVWGYYSAEDVQVFQRQEGNAYSWDQKVLTFHTCKTCGCTTHYTAPLADGTERIAINARMAPRDVMEAIPTRRFDGADTWSFIDE